jgi:XisI protein
MDKIKRYQDIIIDFLKKYEAETYTTFEPKTTRRVLIDRDNNSFQLLAIGWKNDHYMFGPIFHFDIIDGKVWLQCNNTEWEVVDFLMEKGVDRQDIVLGFLSPYARQFAGFAVN